MRRTNIPEDKDEKKHNTPSLIHLNIRDNTLVSLFRSTVNYFNNNDYIKTYKIYNETNNEIIKSIDDEINELKSLRNVKY